MYSLTWVGIKNPDIHYKIFHSTMVPPLGLNRGFYHNDKLDKQLNLALNSNDWREVIETIHSDVAFLPLWYEGNVVVYSDKITDYRASNDGNWQGLKYIKKDDS
jgi:peptide/nickel transport system substrate-binding protein